MKQTSLLLAAFAMAFTALADPSSTDDAGDKAGTALVIPAAGYNATHTLGHRSDTDFFVFTAIPYATYSFTVSEVSVPDLDVCLRAADGSYILGRKNSISSGSATLAWPPAGFDNSSGGLLYLDVRSLGESKTGTYRLNMNVNFGPDGDNDKLPDQWEVGPWGNGSLVTAPATGAGGSDGWQHDKDGDGFSNWQELQMGTDPTVKSSSLVILDIDKGNVMAEVQWPAVKYGFYEVSWRNNDTSTAWATDGLWTVIDSMLYTGNSGNIWTDDVDGTPPVYKIYRVQQFGISNSPFE